MQLRALKELPQGQQPGQIFTAESEAIADLLVQVGAAERVPDAKTPKTYLRRDMKAERT